MHLRTSLVGATFMCIAATSAIWQGCQSSHSTHMPSNFKYPTSRVEPVIDTLWETEVADPYRWLEDDRASETSEWVDAQNALTRSHLDSIPLRAELRSRFEALFNYEKIGVPRKMGGRYFISKNDGLQNQSVWFVRETLNGTDALFLDPNLLSNDGTVTASLGSASEDERWVTVIQSSAGSDWQEIHLYDLNSGESTGEILNWVKFSGTSWA